MKTFGLKFKKILWGLFFIFAAAFVIMNQTGSYIEIGLWSSILTVFLVAVIIEGIVHSNFFGAIVPLGFLAIIYKEPLGIADINAWAILAAAVLLSIGLSTLFGKKNYFPIFHIHDWGKDKHRTNSEHFEDSDNIECRVSFGGSTKYLQSTNLQSAYLSCSFGDLNVFFDNVTLDPAGAEVRVDCSFGEIELYIPKAWQVENYITATLGDVKETGYREKDRTSPILKIVGGVSFGDVKIIYV